MCFVECSEGQIVTSPLGVRWVRHKNVSHPNHSASATILPTCCALTESPGLSDLNDISIISFGVPRRISRAVRTTDFTTYVYTLPHIMVPKFASQLPIRKCRTNVQRQRKCLKLNARAHRRTPHTSRCDNYWHFCKGMLLNFAAWRCYPFSLRRNLQDKRWWVAKTSASKLLVCWLENSRFHFQLCKCCWSRDKIWP